MQAMAVAPIDKEGKVDRSQITIAYAGTDPTDIDDLKTDAVYVAGIERTITKYEHIGNTSSFDQFETALGYTDYIQKKFPEAKVSVTGHSLGGALALTVGAKRKLHTVSFNGPIPQKYLTAKADKESLYTRPVEKLDRKLEALKDIQRKLDTYDKILGERIKKRVADNQELAQRFGL